MFRYNAFGQRALRADVPGEKRTYYLDGLFEYRVDTLTQTSEGTSHVRVGGQLVAEVTQRLDGSGQVSTSIEYPHTDVLGSTSSVSGFGAPQRAYYEPFGALLAQDGLSAGSGPGISHDFTGHERDGELINMRGRMYDPELRRFLTPDPIISDVTTSQDHSGYSYVRNQPFRYVDPTGMVVAVPQHYRDDEFYVDEDGITQFIPEDHVEIKSGYIPVPDAPTWNTGLPIGWIQYKPSQSSSSEPMSGSRTPDLSGLGANPNRDARGIGTNPNLNLGESSPQTRGGPTALAEPVTATAAAGAGVTIALGPFVAAAAVAIGVECALRRDCREPINDWARGAWDAIWASEDNEEEAARPSTLEPGPHAKESIPAHRGRPTAAEQRKVNELMEKHGCHTCSTKNPGTTSGNAVADHQPPQQLAEPEKFYPHCIHCSRRQGGEVLQEILKRRK